MRTIYKWTLETTDRQTVPIQRDAQVLAVQVQHGVPCLWCLVDTDAPLEPQVIYIHGTGHPTHPEATIESYIGTYQLQLGSLVFHVFAPGLLPAVNARVGFLEALKSEGYTRFAADSQRRGREEGAGS